MDTTTTVYGVDVERLTATVNAVAADPALARFQFRAAGGSTRRGRSRDSSRSAPPSRCREAGCGWLSVASTGTAGPITARWWG